MQRKTKTKILLEFLRVDLHKKFEDIQKTKNEEHDEEIYKVYVK